MAERVSIFDLERRVELPKEFTEAINNLQAAIVYSRFFKGETLYACLDESMRTWPYRDAANSIEKYAQTHGFSFSNRSETDVIYSFELLINLLRWAVICEDEHSGAQRKTWGSVIKRFTSECHHCIENIEYLLAMTNMTVRMRYVPDNIPQYLITKRDVDVDALIEAVPDLADTLLSYLDIRNQNNLDAKRAILHKIAAYLEPQKHAYKGTMYNQLCDDLFFAFNNCSIRHNDGKQVAFTNERELADAYDKTFKAAVFLLHKENIDEFHKLVSSLKGV